MHDNVIHSCYIPTAVFKMQNSTGGVNQKCIEAYSSTNETWKCLSIQYAEPFTSTRLFALNSIYDSWQLANILQIPCKPPDCDPRYMEAVENYGKVRFSAVMILIMHCIIASMFFLHLLCTFLGINYWTYYAQNWCNIGIFEDSGWSHVKWVSRLLLWFMHHPLSVFGYVVEQDKGQGSECGHHVCKLVLQQARSQGRGGLCLPMQQILLEWTAIFFNAKLILLCSSHHKKVIDIALTHAQYAIEACPMHFWPFSWLTACKWSGRSAQWRDWWGLMAAWRSLQEPGEVRQP